MSFRLNLVETLVKFSSLGRHVYTHQAGNALDVSVHDSEMTKHDFDKIVWLAVNILKLAYSSLDENEFTLTPPIVKPKLGPPPSDLVKRLENKK
jgi:hypothetical protein